MFKTGSNRRAVLVGLLVLFCPTGCAAQEGEMTFRVIAAKNCSGLCPSEIVADGMITLESAEEFRKIAATRRPNPIIVRFASSGGSLVGSLQLGKALRAFDSTVIVGKGARCVSACVYAFLGGVARHAGGGQIGVHRFRPGGEETEQDFPTVLVQRATEVLTAYVAQMGVDPELVKLAMGVSPPAVRFLDRRELRRFHVIN